MDNNVDILTCEIQAHKQVGKITSPLRNMDHQRTKGMQCHT